MSHPFGDLLNQHRARKSDLTQAKLAILASYDASLVAKMCQGKKELTGPSGRERVVRLIEVLREQGALTALDEANALLDAAGMQPLFERQPAEAKLIQLLRTTQPERAAQQDAATRSSSTPNNLRAQLTLFFGREKEVAELAARVQTRTARLWTLTGAGGVGKSRLAQQVATQVLDEFEDGVWLVELAPISEPSLIVDTVASAFDLRPTNRSTQDTLGEYLRGKHLLLVLDNCEHLIAACAALADSLLRLPQLHILATSREPLGVPGESLWRVPSLANEEAVHLFMDRARSAKADFTLTEQNATSVVQLCSRLEPVMHFLTTALPHERASRWRRPESAARPRSPISVRSRAPSVGIVPTKQSCARRPIGAAAIRSLFWLRAA